MCLTGQKKKAMRVVIMNVLCIWSLPEYLALSLKNLCCEFLNVKYFRTYQYTLFIHSVRSADIEYSLQNRLDGETMINKFGLEHSLWWVKQALTHISTIRHLAVIIDHWIQRTNTVCPENIIHDPSCVRRIQGKIPPQSDIFSKM